MTGGFDAAGDIATGALLGRAVEPRAGEAGYGDAHGICLNCGTALIGEYCHACGQNGHIHRTLRSIGHDLLHGVFHFEGKIWRTLPMLTFHPGALTRRYVAGERARFVSPLALFLFFVFLMFAVIHALAGDIAPPEMSPAKRTTTVAQFDKEIAKVHGELDAIAVARAAAEKAGKPTQSFDEQQGELQVTLKPMETARDMIEAGGDTPTSQFVSTDLKTHWARLDEAIAKANANPGLAIYKLQASAYKYSWALIPISVPFVALLFLWRRQYRLYDHTIFVIYSLDFMSVLVIVLSLAGAIGVSSSAIALVGTFAPPIHIYKQLRGAYQLRRFSAAWRMLALLVFAFIALLAFLLLLLGLGLMG